MISESRFKNHFTVVGDFSTHYGPFDCTVFAAQEGISTNISGACC